MHCWRRILVATTCLLVVGAGCKKSNGNSNESESAKAESPSKDKKKGDDETKTASAQSDSDKSKEDLPFEATGPVAKVNGTEISAKKFNDTVRKVAGRMRRGIPPQMVDKFKNRTIKRVIDTHLIDKEIAEAGIEVSDEEIEKEFKKFKERFPDDKRFESFLKFRNTSEKELKKNMRKELSLQKLLKKRKGIEVTEEDAKKYYENNSKEFEQKEQIKASHILIKTEKGASDKKVEKARKKAEELAKKAKKSGTDFSKLAEKHSEGPTSKKGGDLGYFTRDKMVSEFSDKAFSMKNGEISDPVKTRFGFHVIKRTGHKEAGKKTFEEAKSDILSRLEKKKISKNLKSFVKELRDKAEIEEMPDNIKVNVDPTKKRGGGMGLGGGGSKKMQLQKLKEKLKKRQQQQQQKNEGSSKESNSSGSGSGE